MKMRQAVVWKQSGLPLEDKRRSRREGSWIEFCKGRDKIKHRPEELEEGGEMKEKLKLAENS